jgi:hypothetical protein
MISLGGLDDLLINAVFDGWLVDLLDQSQRARAVGCRFVSHPFHTLLVCTRQSPPVRWSVWNPDRCV